MAPDRSMVAARLWMLLAQLHMAASLKSVLVTARAWCNSMPRHWRRLEASLVWKASPNRQLFRASTTCCSTDKVRSSIGYADAVSQFKLRNMEAQKEFATSVEHMLDRQPSETPCHRFIQGALRRRVDALSEALEIGRTAFQVIQRALSAALDVHCLLPHDGKSLRTLQRKLGLYVTRLVTLAQSLHRVADSLDAGDWRDWVEAGELDFQSCYPASFASGVLGVRLPQPAAQQLVHNVHYPLTDHTSGVRAWNAWFDRFSLVFSRFPAKLGYQLKVFTSSFEPAFIQGPWRPVFWGKDFLVDADAPWHWPVNRSVSNAQEPERRHLASQGALMLMISNLTTAHTVERLWNDSSQLLESTAGLEVLWVEDSIREPWVIDGHELPTRAPRTARAVDSRGLDRTAQQSFHALAAAPSHAWLHGGRCRAPACSGALRGLARRGRPIAAHVQQRQPGVCVRRA